jgi:hypothetical protein
MKAVDEPNRDRKNSFTELINRMSWSDVDLTSFHTASPNLAEDARRSTQEDK